MAHSFSALYYHIIYSTRNREPLLTPQLKTRMFDYMGGIIRGMDGTSLLINGVEDHVHILAKLPTKHAVADVIRDLKADSSGWARRTLNVDFGWQTGYSIFSVSISMTETAQAYIAKQEEHHRRVSFHDEYIDFLKRHHIQFDPRFVFEGEFAA